MAARRRGCSPGARRRSGSRLLSHRSRRGNSACSTRCSPPVRLNGCPWPTPHGSCTPSSVLLRELFVRRDNSHFCRFLSETLYYQALYYEALYYKALYYEALYIDLANILYRARPCTLHTPGLCTVCTAFYKRYLQYAFLRQDSIKFKRRRRVSCLLIPSLFAPPRTVTQRLHVTCTCPCAPVHAHAHAHVGVTCE